MIARSLQSLSPMRRLDLLFGGPRRRRIILSLGAVLALQTADTSTVGSDAAQLEAGLHINTAQVGLLLSVGLLTGVVLTLPAGMLTDRMTRTRLLGWAIATWAVAMALCAAAPNFHWLLIFRVALGGVTAIAGPATASLIGDYFPANERGRIYGYVLCGELVGAGFGLVVAGELAVVSWRVPFLALMLPSAYVCWLVLRLEEPARGGRHRSVPEPDADTDATHVSLAGAVKYVLGIRTNLVLIVAAMFGSVFFSGLRGFAVQFTAQHYRVPHGLAVIYALIVGLGALGGILMGGRLADTLLRRGHLTARVDVPGLAVLGCAALFLPALITTRIGIALPLLVVAVGCLGAATAPLDAARLDVVVPSIWGRAEGIRTVLRDLGEAAGPLIFGILADSAFTGSTALRDTFLVTLLALAAEAAMLLLLGRRTYPADRSAAQRAASSGRLKP